MSNQKKTCGTCSHYRRTKCRGGKGGRNLACGKEVEEYYAGPYITFFDRARTPEHPCHRPEDYERKERR